MGRAAPADVGVGPVRRAAPLLACGLLAACGAGASSPGAAPDADASTPTPPDLADSRVGPSEEVSADPDVSAGPSDAPIAEPDQVAASDGDAAGPDTPELPTWLAWDGPTLVATCDQAGLRLTPYADGVLRLHYVAPGDPSERRSWAVVAEPPAAEVELTAGDAAVELRTDQLVATVTGGTCALSVTDPAGHVLLADGDAGGWYQDAETVGVRRVTPEGEAFYGLGERVGTGLDRRGGHFVSWNTDAYSTEWGGYAPDQDPLYLGVPFYAALRAGVAYGVLTDDAHRLEVDLAAAEPERLTLALHGGAVDQYVFAGPTLPEVLRRYTALTGRTPLPPRWSLGYHQCRWGYAPDDRLHELAAEFRAREIPCDALWLDIQHLDGFRTFTWDPAGFPDPAGLASALEAEGFALTVIADPGIKVDPGWDVYDSGLAGGHFLETAPGEPFVGAVWPGPSVFPDFTSPPARAWWAGWIGGLAGLGVKGIWLDVNEPTVFPESGGGQSVDEEVPAAGDGAPTTMAEAHNVYALQEALATREGLLAAQPGARPFVLSRAGFAGLQRVAATWTGDVPSTWWGLQHSLPMMLGLGLSGVPFVGSDVGGYSGDPGPELFARWLALGSISPFFRGHVTHGAPDQEPWAFGQEVEDISRRLIERRYRLLPYLASLFAEAAETGAPVLRPLVWHFQHDAAVADLGDQAMLGPWLLVAPVLEEGAGQRKAYLPEGRWFDLLSGAILEGPTVHISSVRLAALPTWVREGAILPFGPLLQHTGEGPLSPLELHLYPAEHATTFTLHEDDDAPAGAVARTTYTLQRSETGATFQAAAREGSLQPPARTLVLRVRRVDHGASAVRVDGAASTERSSLDELMAAGDGWWWDPADLSVVVALEDRAPLQVELDYDPTLLEPAPPVEVPFLVTLPPGTPAGPDLHVASAAWGWEHLPVGPVVGETAAGTVTVPRGGWFDYKYSRGDWCTVEKWPDCQEAQDRYGYGAAWPVRQDTIWGWREWCDPCP